MQAYKWACKFIYNLILKKMNTKAFKKLVVASPALATLLLAGTTVFGSGWDLGAFKTQIVTEGQNALTWVIWIVIWLLSLYLLPVILRYLSVIVKAMRSAMWGFFGGNWKSK